jgi:hypothetical protein
MAALSNPVNANNVISRFFDYVRATAQSGGTWGSNYLPTYQPGYGYADVQVIPAGAMGGNNYDDPGINTYISGAYPVQVINAYNIYNYLNYFTYEYCYIRNVRAVLTVTGDGGDQGTLPTPGNVYDATAVAYLNFRNIQTGMADFVYATPGGVTAGQGITAFSMEDFLSRCRTAYNNFARNQTYLWNPIICHASCHLSCHASRGRR